MVTSATNNPPLVAHPKHYENGYFKCPTVRLDRKIKKAVPLKDPTQTSFSLTKQLPDNPRKPRPYEIVHFKSRVSKIGPDRIIAKLQREASRVLSKDQPVEREKVQMPVGSSVSDRSEIDDFSLEISPAEKSSRDEPQTVKFISEQFLADVRQAPSLTVNYSGLNPPFGWLSFDQIVTIGRQSLEFLAECRRFLNLHPSKLMFDPVSRFLKVVVDVKIDQLISDPFYGCPKAVLQGKSNRSDDLWSLGCILFELWTHEPLFLADSGVDPNTMLHQMAYQIGMPAKEFLKKFRASESYFILEPEVQFRQTGPSAPIYWKNRVQFAGQVKQISQTKIDNFIQLLDQMLVYENRPSPKDILKLPLFEDDVRFLLPSDFTGKITLYRASDIEVYLAYHTAEPLPSAHIDGSTGITQKYVHILRDPLNHYFVFIERNGITFHPERLMLKDGNSLVLGS